MTLGEAIDRAIIFLVIISVILTVALAATTHFALKDTQEMLEQDNFEELRQSYKRGFNDMHKFCEYKEQHRNDI